MTIRETAARFLVSGRVQGVAFRAYTRQQALALGLRGYARNLADGRVEVLAVGEAEAVDRIQQWLHRGSPMAEVEQVHRRPADASESGVGFAVE